VFRGDAVENEIRLSGGAVRIGRHAGNDVVLDDSLNGVSRFHAEIRPEGNSYVIVDQSGAAPWCARDRRRLRARSRGRPVRYIRRTRGESANRCDRATRRHRQVREFRQQLSEPFWRTSISEPFDAPTSSRLVDVATEQADTDLGWSHHRRARHLRLSIV